jgi:esterase/lipase superfamily enzyme
MSPPRLSRCDAPHRKLLLLAACALLTACVEAPSIGAAPGDGARAGQDVSELAFVTNRGVVRRRNGERRFGNEPGALAGGRCSVALDEDGVDARVVAVSESTAARTLDELTSRHGEIVVYFHGYYEDFERSCRRAAVFREALALDAGFLLFSWPANSTPFTYGDDVRDLEASIPAFLDLLDSLGQRVGRDRVSIVAHSLGSRGLVRALRDWPATGDRFRDLVLIAADVDRALFLEALPALRDQVERLTILVSGRDLALRISEAVNQAPRLGRSLEAPMDGVDIRDVTAIADTHLSGHLYHLRNDRVVDIIREVLERDREPEASGK